MAQIVQLPVWLDIRINKGATFFLPLEFTGGDGELIDWTGYSARMQVRKSINANETILDLTSDDDDITLDDKGNIVVTVSDAVTAAIVENSGVYDLEVESGGGIVTRLFEGSVVIAPEVTRA